MLSDARREAQVRVDEQPRQLRWLESRLLGLAGGVPELRAAVREAAQRAATLDGSAALDLPSVVLSADVLAALAHARRMTREDLDEVAEALAERLGLPAELISASIHLRLHRDPRLLALPPDEALALQLQLLSFAADLSHASLWTENATTGVECVTTLPEGRASPRARAVALRVVVERSPAPATRRGSFHGVPVLLEGQPVAALVVQVGSRTVEETGFLVGETARQLAPLIEKLRLVQSNAEKERVVVESVERQRVRLGLDVHDGPLQQVALLSGEARHLRDQLPELVARGDLARAVGRIQDMEALVIGLDRDLREIARSHTPAIDEHPFDETLRATAEAFSSRARIPVEVQIDGDLAGTTRSQRMALLRIVQEALANVREHSGASSAQVTLTTGPEGILLEIVDDGCGFDVPKASERARSAGRFGLAGMLARVRLLGGSLDIESVTGGPTVVTATIPDWRPGTAQAASAHAAAGRPAPGAAGRKERANRGASRP